MKIFFHGATGYVTGSAYHVLTEHASVLVDCGLFQGKRSERKLNFLNYRLEGRRLDAVVLTHGHLDHVGRLPLLTRKGYDGPIYGTRATLDLGKLILLDALALQMSDFERQNRRRMAERLPPLKPLYDEQDVQKLKGLGREVAYGEVTNIAPGIKVRLVDAGHVIGSASIEMTVEEGGRNKTVIFSGDLGPRGAPLLNDPFPFGRADAVIMETTYGDRDHRSLRETALEGREIIARVIEKKAKILVPIFAVGRTQLLLYMLAAAFGRGTLTPFPIYLDSPMAIEATKVYGKHNELFDEEARRMAKSGELRSNLEWTRPTLTPEESRAINEVTGPCMIMAGNGSCTGGRIIHHLRHNLKDPGTAVLISGFQSPRTIGRQLVDGAKAVSIFGQKVPVNASVHTMGGFSSHAGQSDLLKWFGTIAPSKPRLILTHGEDKARTKFSELVEERHGIKAECPELGDMIEI